jgi:DNA-binding response OmpR family regulator
VILKPEILIVEDDPLVSGLLVATLDLFYDTIVCGTGQCALFVIENETADLILLDLRLNGSEFAGLDVLAMVKTRPRFRHIPIIIITGDTSEDSQSMARRIGAHAYITKPFNPIRLLDIIGEILGMK